MTVRCVVAVLLGASMFAQTPPAPCPSDRPVDDIIAEVKKLQSKKNNRNKSPLPDCILGWCRENAKTPPTFPQSEPTLKTRSNSDSDTSSSKNPVDRCNQAMEIALEAAHNVEVGDFYFEQKNFKAASLRYKDAVEHKPQDAAIHVRLGRVFEKLNEPSQAIDHYQAAEKLGVPEKWVEEARSALARLKR